MRGRYSFFLLVVMSFFFLLAIIPSQVKMVGGVANALEAKDKFQDIEKFKELAIAHMADRGQKMTLDSLEGRLEYEDSTVVYNYSGSINDKSAGIFITGRENPVECKEVVYYNLTKTRQSLEYIYYKKLDQKKKRLWLIENFQTQLTVNTYNEEGKRLIIRNYIGKIDFTNNTVYAYGATKEGTHGGMLIAYEKKVFPVKGGSLWYDLLYPSNRKLFNGIETAIKSLNFSQVEKVICDNFQEYIDMDIGKIQMHAKKQ
jgi:hypothetical protein